MSTQTHSRHSRTKSQSFEEMTGSALSAQQQMVMELFTDSILRCTREDIAAATNLKLSSVCGRVRELMDAGRLVNRGERRDCHSNRNHELVGLPANS